MPSSNLFPFDDSINWMGNTRVSDFMSIPDRNRFTIDALGRHVSPFPISEPTPVPIQSLPGSRSSPPVPGSPVDFGAPNLTSFQTFNYQTPTDLAKTSAEENLAAIPTLEKVSQAVNRINTLANQSRIPGGEELEKQSSVNIADELAGRLPQDYLDMLGTRIAEQGAIGGFSPDSPYLNSAAMRAMGLTSLERQRQGQADLTSAYNRAAPLYDVSKGFVTPEMQQRASEFAATLGLDYAKLNQQERQFIATQSQDWAKYQQTFGENVRQFNASNRLDQERLARQMGLSWAELQVKINEANMRGQEAQDQLANQMNIAQMKYDFENAKLAAATQHSQAISEADQMLMGDSNLPSENYSEPAYTTRTALPSTAEDRYWFDAMNEAVLDAYA